MELYGDALRMSRRSATTARSGDRGSDRRVPDAPRTSRPGPGRLRCVVAACPHERRCSVAGPAAPPRQGRSLLQTGLPDAARSAFDLPRSRALPSARLRDRDSPGRHGRRSPGSPAGPTPIGRESLATRRLGVGRVPVSRPWLSRPGRPEPADAVLEPAFASAGVAAVPRQLEDRRSPFARTVFEPRTWGGLAMPRGGSWGPLWPPSRCTLHVHGAPLLLSFQHRTRTLDRDVRRGRRGGEDCGPDRAS